MVWILDCLVISIAALIGVISLRSIELHMKCIESHLNNLQYRVEDLGRVVYQASNKIFDTNAPKKTDTLCYRLWSISDNLLHLREVIRGEGKEKYAAFTRPTQDKKKIG